MIPRHLKITFVLLIAAALATGVYVWTLRRHARQAPQNTQLQQPVAPPSAGAPVTVALYIADDQQGRLRREDASITLPSDPALRAQVILRALLARYAQKDSPHPLPSGADVNDVYVVNGTAVVDLNDAFAGGHRSGVMVEELTVLSLVQTLAENSPGIAQVKILVNGQERDTLAGHADLADFYDVAAVNRVVGLMGGASSQESGVRSQESSQLEATRKPSSLQRILLLPQLRFRRRTTDSRPPSPDSFFPRETMF